jgi:hypothetical protein
MCFLKTKVYIYTNKSSKVLFALTKLPELTVPVPLTLIEMAPVQGLKSMAPPQNGHVRRRHLSEWT